MKTNNRLRRIVALLLALALMPFSLGACSSRGAQGAGPTQEDTGADASRRLVVVDNEPDTVDFQCTSIHYTVALNAFNRLVEMQSTEDGSVAVMPSLAKAWEVSDDGRVYTFHLREGVTFSNGSPLTASDVEYTFTRLLTHPNACNQDIADGILGAQRLEAGEADRLEGFEVLGELDFVITLAQPFEAFLACLSMPGASILDRETTEAAGDRFGTDPDATVGTGAYILKSWDVGKGMLLVVNPTCWEGPPANDGLDVRFITNSATMRRMFENGELDILDLNDLGTSAEYFIHGDIYQDRLLMTQQIAITYIALNESVAPLGDARVRRALQLALNRQTLLDSIYSGRGELENGIFPHGLSGYNPDLPEIPCDPQVAAALLGEAGYPDGFDLTVSVSASSTLSEKKLMTLAADMWSKIGVRASVEVLDAGEFMRLRKSGALACYSATWSADFNDPDNFIYTFFGNRENTAFRSLCYPDEAVMERVCQARAITDTAARIREYQALEEIIVQRDAAWVPLFSRTHYFVASERVEQLKASWNGWVSTSYRFIAMKEPTS